ncbi:MAG: IPTL-CTERM sorting domain-containing protein [Gallionellaceae bacterium]
MKLLNILGAMILSSAISAQAATWNFSTCGATGASGPSQTNCNTAYAGNPSVSVTGGIQTWTVPATGTYRITAIGAQGAAGDASGDVGGRGASITGDFSLTAGQTLKLVVGQQGLGQGSAVSAGGGGGSFVVSAANVPMLIAGGGGGNRESASQNGCDASITEYAVTGSGSSSSSSCTLESTDLGLGGIISSSSYGSAGAGFNGDGATDPSWGGTHGGGYDWANGMLGGQYVSGCSDNAAGGFGGGGSGNGCDGGGGGGGYSGGDSGWIAGGGGSYNTGSNPVATAGVGTGNGSIVIQSLTTSAIPTLSQWGMIILSSLLALGAVFALRRLR